MWVLDKMRVEGKLIDNFKCIYQDETIVELDLLCTLAKKYPLWAKKYADEQLDNDFCSEQKTSSTKIDLTHETIEKIAFQVSKNMRK
jgi:hypothetical protein